ncbi:MAG: lytic murein transglycosylase [Hyphomicrobiaceae bacterium]|nr:lytic murein transglycosylase [Hyphomicrobiaceae bacterium]
MSLPQRVPAGRSAVQGAAVSGLRYAAALVLLLAPNAARAQPVAASAHVDQNALAEGLAPRLASFLSAMRRDALGAGVSVAILDRALAGIAIDASIPPLLTAQPEHVMAPWDYMGRLVSDTRIEGGRRMLAEHRETLDAIETRFGVDRHAVVAIWGVESSYGTLPGTRAVVRSLATLAVADARRAPFWRKELLAALTILDRGDITPERMTGSWAGAMGHTQFMPSSYLTHAVDHDADGRRDIWQSVPDALASTASYLHRSGWKAGEPWGLEVALPAGFDYRLADPGASRTSDEWQALGVVPPPGAEWPAGMPASSMLLPAGMHGPAFLIAGNFKAILRYNNATAYALAVGHLSDRLAGRPPLLALWPTHDPPLARAERRELQELLSRMGLDVGPIDGVLGETTRNAVRQWQRRQGVAEDGWPGSGLLGVLRARAASVR